MRKGFTLIELLIVVAIIAILAAIAVPNFLEAQTRAKVSRAKADMRTMATALESYTVDNNKPMTIQIINQPSGTLNGISVVNPSLAGNAWGSARFMRLTTPIAYITSVLVDPFAKDGRTALASGGISTNYDTYDYISAFDFMNGALFDSTSADPREGGITSGAGWRLASAGPDKIQTFGGGYVGQTYTDPLVHNSWGADYDATNGTISIGDIIRVGGGVGPSRGAGRSVPCVDRIKNQNNGTQGIDF